MPLYFGSDNKIYDSDLDGSTAYAGNTADYKAINYSIYDHIISNNLKNKQVVFSDIQENFSTPNISNKPFILSPKEKIEHFKNLTNYYINKNKIFVGLDGNISDLLNSSITGISSDTQAFLNWKNDVIEYRNSKINDFETGVTGIPTLSEFINEKNFPLLASYRNGLFTGGINNQPPIMGLVISEGRGGPAITPGYTSYCRDGQTSDCCLIRSDTIVSEDHQTSESSFDNGNWTFYEDGSFNPSPEEDLTGGISFIFPDSFYDEMEIIMRSPTAQEEFETFFENYFAGGNVEVVNHPTIKLIQKDSNGTTSDVWLTIFPKFEGPGSPQGNGRVPVGTTYVSHPRDINLWTQELWDAFLLSYLEYTGVVTDWCCDELVTDIPATADFYDSETNPCGISDICQWCNVMINYGFKIFGPHRCPMTTNWYEYWDYDRRTGERREIPFPGRGYFPRTKEIEDRNIPIEQKGGDPNSPADPDGDICIRSEDKTGDKFLESPCYQPSCHSLGRCYDCYEGTVATVGTRTKSIIYENRFILSHRKGTAPQSFTPRTFSCYSIDLSYSYYCSSAQSIQHAQSCGCEYCPCDHENCQSLTCSEEQTKIPTIANPNEYE